MEVWKDVKGFEGYYQVSSLGNVRSVERTIEVTRPSGTYRMTLKGRNMVLGTNKKGYKRVELCRQNSKKRHQYLVHRLVAEAFIPNPENLPEVNHESGDKTDNSVENLTWCDRLGNIHHAIEHGFINKRGTANWNAVLNDDEVRDIRKKFEQGVTAREMADHYGLHPDTIRDIKRGKTWKHVL